MLFTRLHFRAAAWLAAASVLAAAVVPSIAHFVSRAGGPELIICSATDAGSGRTTPAPGLPAKTAHGQGDCAYCTTPLPLLGLASDVATFIGAVHGPQVGSTRASEPRCDSIPYPRARSRAPPILA